MAGQPLLEVETERWASRRLLIANRGEIAVRIMRAARELGIATIQVHSAADAELLAVRLADEAVEIGPPHAAKSYLNVAAILKAARGDRGGRGPSGLRLPVRERRFRRGGRGGRPGLRRADARDDPAHGRQGRRARGGQGRRAFPSCPAARASSSDPAEAADSRRPSAIP